MFDNPPVFNSDERKRFFSFPNCLKEKANALRKPSTKVGFLLAGGYFKAAKKFFRPEDFHQNDIAYVARSLNIESKQFAPEYYVQSTRQWHQDIILEFYGYKRFGENALRIIEHEIFSMMRSQLKPKLIFWRCIDILVRERVQIPPYFQLSGRQSEEKRTYSRYSLRIKRGGKIIVGWFVYTGSGHPLCQI